PERVAAHAQLVSYLLQRPPALAEQPYRLDLELKRVGRISGSSLHGQSFPSNLAQAGICPPKRGNSTPEPVAPHQVGCAYALQRRCAALRAPGARRAPQAAQAHQARHLIAADELAAP